MYLLDVDGCVADVQAGLDVASRFGYKNYPICPIYLIPSQRQRRFLVRKRQSGSKETKAARKRTDVEQHQNVRLLQTLRQTSSIFCSDHTLLDQGAPSSNVVESKRSST